VRVDDAEAFEMIDRDDKQLPVENSLAMRGGRSFSVGSIGTIATFIRNKLIGEGLSHSSPTPVPFAYVCIDWPEALARPSPEWNRKRRNRRSTRGGRVRQNSGHEILSGRTYLPTATGPPEPAPPRGPDGRATEKPKTFVGGWTVLVDPMPTTSHTNRVGAHAALGPAAAGGGRGTPFELGSGDPTYKQARGLPRPRRFDAMKNKQVS
ncbi:hypothetical protein THAOC_00514, partial [Thalassiosira oceanica]